MALADPIPQNPDGEDLPLRPRLWTADEYLHAAEAGIFGEDERLELLEGEIVYMSPQGVRHLQSVTRINRWLGRVLPDGLDLLVQSTTRMTPMSVPEPDFAVVKRSVDDLTVLPQASDLLLVIEVSDSTLSTDRNRKARIYSSAGIAEYWIVNLRSRVLEVHREPAEDGYRLIRRYGEIEEVEPPFGGSVLVSDLLPKK